MPGKDKLEFDVLANDKASGVFDKVANAGKDVGKALDTGADKGAKALDNLQKAGKEAGESLGKIGDKGKEGLGKLTDAFKAGPLVMLGLGAGLGETVMEGFSEAFEQQDATAVLTAQVGASNADMGKLGKIAGDMYKNAFGDSAAEVSGVLKTVFQSGLAAVSDSEDKIKGITAQVMNYSKITGEEALPVTRAISQMLKTGLAKNATEAFDLLTRGVQKGLDKSEDLLDTVNEYGTQFRKVGLTGQQAFGLISQAIQAGARDSDIAADAIKEFSIRAVDGSDSTKQGFEGIGLSAKTMAAEIIQGGPKAAAALDLTLDKLRAVKDPTKQAQLAVQLFGTQAEDLGQALYAMNLDTATKEFGNVAGAAERAGDVINDTASNKMATIGRTIKQSIVDGITKYALPKLEEFADWFIGPGKMTIVSWAISAGEAILDFSDKTLGALQTAIPAVAKFGAAALVAAAGAVALSNPTAAKDLLMQAKSMNEWANSTTKGLESARGKLQEWKGQLASTNTTVKLQANIDDLDAKIAKAQRELRDPGLTKERRAELTANITRLTAARDAALKKLNDPGLVKARVAQLQANKADLDKKIAAAQNALKAKGLTATKTASLKADIRQLLRQKSAAQQSINSLTGKTVPVTVKFSYANMLPQYVDPGLVASGRGRERGGPVTKGTPYIVGEKRAELFVPDENGRIVPEVPRVNRGGSASPAYAGSGGAYAAVATLSFDDSETSRFLVRMLRKGLNNGGAQGNVQILLGGRPA